MEKVRELRPPPWVDDEERERMETRMSLGEHALAVGSSYEISLDLLKIDPSFSLEPTARPIEYRKRCQNWLYESTKLSCFSTPAHAVHHLGGDLVPAQLTEFAKFLCVTTHSPGSTIYDESNRLRMGTTEWMMYDRVHIVLEGAIVIERQQPEGDNRGPYLPWCQFRACLIRLDHCGVIFQKLAALGQPHYPSKELGALLTSEAGAKLREIRKIFFLIRDDFESGYSNLVGSSAEAKLQDVYNLAKWLETTVLNWAYHLEMTYIAFLLLRPTMLVMSSSISKDYLHGTMPQIKEFMVAVCQTLKMVSEVCCQLKAMLTALKELKHDFASESPVFNSWGEVLADKLVTQLGDLSLPKSMFCVFSAVCF